MWFQPINATLQKETVNMLVKNIPGKAAPDNKHAVNATYRAFAHKLSIVTRHLSLVTRHLSIGTRPIFQIGEDTQLEDTQLCVTTELSKQASRFNFPFFRFTYHGSRFTIPFRFLLVLAIILINIPLGAQTVKIGLLKYSGGGDWYVNPTSLPNLIRFCNETLNTDMEKDPMTVETGSRDIFSLPFVHATGHGNMLFSPQEAENLRQYLLAGGFLHIDDNYGIDQFARREMKKVFPELDFVELPASHPIFQKPNAFPDGLPKIHEHDNKRPQGFGLIWEGRLVCFYSYESDLGDGWEDQAVHNDSQETRLKALKMGANLIHYVFTEK